MRKKSGKDEFSDISVLVKKYIIICRSLENNRNIVLMDSNKV